MYGAKLEGNEYLTLEVDVPWYGGIHYNVESDRPVDVFLMDAEGLKEFEDGSECSVYDDAINVTSHDQRIRLPYRGQAYLVISNPSQEPAVVHYEV